MTPSAAATQIDDIAQIATAITAQLRANPQAENRADNILQAFLGSIIASSEAIENSEFKTEHPSAPPEAIGLAGYVERKRKILVEQGYSELQALLIVMGELGQLTAYTSIAHNEKLIGVIRRVMTYEVKKGAEANLSHGKLTTSLGRTSNTHRDRTRFAMRGRSHRTRN